MDDVFIKKFDAWSDMKKKIEDTSVVRFAKKRDIWWCSFGVNVGTELCGKNDSHERAVLVLKAYNATTIKVLPLSTNSKLTDYTVPVPTGTGASLGVLSQVKTISTKRLTRKIGKLEPALFKKILEAYLRSCI
jgi:mRNA interferase MazF